MFKVINGGLEEKLKKEQKRKDFFIEKYRELFNKYLYYDFDALKAVHCGIKYAARKNIDTKTTYRDMLLFFSELKDIENLMYSLTYHQIISIFPIRKDFDGWKYEAKDYWSTKEYLSTKDLDSVIGEDVDEFLWTYYNSDIMNFGVKLTLVADKLMMMEGKQGILDGFLEHIDPEGKIHTYTINKECGYIYDRNTGKTQPLKRPKHKKPKHINVVSCLQ